MNIRNYSQKTNFKCGVSNSDILPFYVTTLNIPGVQTNISEISGRFGASVNVTPDSLSYSPLSLEILLDEDYKIYIDLLNNIYINIDDGTFKNTVFNFWTTVTNAMGKDVMTVEYYNCIIESISDLELNTGDDTTEQTFNLSIKYDYFKVLPQSTSNKPILRI